MAFPALSALAVIAGLGALIYSSNIVVDRSRKVAIKLGVSDLLIGLTLVSIGTSLPEIFLNITAGFVRLQGIESSGIAVGNVIGSCLSQITIILGLAGLVATLYVSRASLMRDGAMLFIAIGLMYASAMDGEISRVDGLLLVGIYALYLRHISREERIRETGAHRQGIDSPSLADAGILAGALLAVLLSSTLVVREGLSLAAMLGVSPFIIGIMAGVGTSLPELSISLGALGRGARSLSLGNLIGSNITDPLLSIGLGASIAGFIVEPGAIGYDLRFWVFSTIVAVLFLWRNMNLDRKESSVLILLFIVYVYLKANQL
jgi:cation:H+ antiporter